MKQFYAIISAAITLFTATTAFSAAKPWYMADIKQMNSHYYKENCQKINNAQMVRKIGLIAYNLVTHNKHNPHQQLQEIEAELQKIGTKLLAKEQKTLLAIKSKYNVPEQLWSSWIESIKQLKNVNKSAMQQDWPEVVHEQLPNNLHPILCSLLQTNGINPNSLHMRLQTTDPKSAELAHVSTNINYTEKPLTFNHEYTPYTIQFSTKITSLSHDSMYALCSHEIEHLIQQHSTSQLALTMYLQEFCNISDEEIKACSEFNTLNKIHEQQAEILSSIKNPKVAACMVKWRSDGYYPGFLYEKHYYHLTIIDMLWQLHAWVQFFHHGGVSKKIDDMASQIEQYIAQFKLWKNSSQ